MKAKRDVVYLLVIIILSLACARFYYSYKINSSDNIEVYYNQDHALNTEIINQIEDADKFVYFSVYTFTRTDIKEALLAAKYRGLKVVGLTDRDQYNQLDQQKKLITELQENGIPVYLQNHLGIMHTKVLVTDKAYASGSYNWTAAATDLNDEVLEVGHDETLRREYQNILEEMFTRYSSH